MVWISEFKLQGLTHSCVPSFGALQIAFVAVKGGKSQAKVGDFENISLPTDTSGMSDALQQIFMFPPPFTIMIYGKNNHPSKIANSTCSQAQKYYHNQTSHFLCASRGLP